jgi:spoIIIJ-associated protein
MTTRATAQGDDLTKALRTALGDLFDQDVKVQVSIPRDADVSDVSVTVEAAVTWPKDEPRADDLEDEGADEEETSVDERGEDEPSLDDEADAAADFVEGLLDALDLPGHLKIRIIDEEDQAEVEVIDVGGGALIGRRGQTLEAIQELLRSAMQREFQQRSRVKIDVEGYRARRLEKLLEKAEEAIEDALDSGEPQRLEPMDVFERKAVHRLVAERDGVTSRSQGREPGRRVVVELED